MHTVQAAQSRRYTFTVSEEDAERNQQIAEGRKLASKEAKQRQDRYAEALRLDRVRDREREEAERSKTASVVVVKTAAPVEKPRVIYTPTPEETEVIRNDIARREEARLSAFRRSEAVKAKTNLLRWAEQTKPPINLFVEEVVAALFDYARDDRNAAVYVCEGVEIRAYGAAINPETRGVKQWNRNLSEEKLRAKARRDQSAAQRSQEPIDPSVRLKREADRESRRLARQAAQPKKGAGGQKDVRGQGKDDKKGNKKK